MRLSGLSRISRAVPASTASRAQNETWDQDHGSLDEQRAMNGAVSAEDLRSPWRRPPRFHE